MQLILIRLSFALLIALVALPLCLVIGCNPPVEHEDAGAVRELTIVADGPLKVIAEVSNSVPAKGAVFTNWIRVVPQGDSQIGTVEVVMFYDHDKSETFDTERDGVVLSFSDSTADQADDFSFSPGFVHAGPGIGPLRIACAVEVVSAEGERNSFTLNADLSAIFEPAALP